MISTMMAISTYRSGATFSSVPSTGAAPSQGAVLSFSSPTRKTYTMYYGTKSATFTPSLYPQESSGVYHLTKPVRITQPETTAVTRPSSKSVQSLPSKIYGNTTSEMSVYQSGNKTVSAWYSPTQGRTIPNSNTFCPTCSR
ncbi:MAG: hypothetical protein LBQ50_02295 [Planctomycetaceae bacterium]|jgi:hypothetical protein|nr:hypothetical protein [Planctomycetaceae bacterium]